jgi:hypothetical protein
MPNNPGKPRIYTERMQTYVITMTPSHAKIARKLGMGNLSGGIRKSLDSGLSQTESSTYATKKKVAKPLDK